MTSPYEFEGCNTIQSIKREQNFGQMFFTYERPACLFSLPPNIYNTNFNACFHCISVYMQYIQLVVSLSLISHPGGESKEQSIMANGISSNNLKPRRWTRD